MPKRVMGRETPPIQSLDRGLMMLDAVARSPEPVSLSQLTALLGIDRSSVFRLANTLKRRGFLAYPGGRKDYVLGSALWRLSHHYDWGTMLIRVAREPLRELSARTNETAHLAIREGRQALLIDHATSHQVIMVAGQTGEIVPLHCTAHGKVLLADLEERELRSFFGRAPLRKYTKQTVRTVAQLAEMCAQTRAQGFATDDGEYQDGLRCVAAPIRAHDGMIVGSIGISAPALRFPKERYKSCGAQVAEIANRITAEFSADAKLA
jgi:IclR family transcriptional regulator, acetate operon repressor